MGNELQSLCDSNLQRITRFIDEQSVLAKRYENALAKRKRDFEFNIFNIISHVYYRENLHSDILSAFLDPRGPHGEGDKFLVIFLKLLTDYGLEFDLECYKNASVKREEFTGKGRRIDLSIKGKGRTIIVENKVNNASDQERQLPEYLEHVKAQHHMCDAIVYLPLTGSKPPDTKNWSKSEVEEVEGCLRILPFYRPESLNLLDGWVRKCERVSLSVDLQFIFKHYGCLIEKLGVDHANEPIMDQFYEIMNEEERFGTAVSLRGMLNALVKYRRDRIVRFFAGKSEPFRVVEPSAPDWVQFYVERQGGLRIDIEVGEDCYWFYFWVNHSTGAQSSEPNTESVLSEMQCREKFSEPKDAHSRWKLNKTFKFPSEEQELYKYVEGFIGGCRQIGKLGK